MQERKLLAAAVASRDAHKLLERHLEEADLTEPSRVVMSAIAEFYNRDASARACDAEVTENLVRRSVTNPKHKETLVALFQSAAQENVSASNIAIDLLETKMESIGMQIAQKLAAGGGVGDVGELMDQYDRLRRDGVAALEGEVEEEDEVLHAPTVESLVYTSDGQEQKHIKVFPKALNDRLRGGLLPGHHVILFARPEMGKTLFLVNMTYGFLKQGLKVLYVANEEPITDIALRILSRLTGMTEDEMREHPEKANEVSTSRGIGNLYLKRLTPGTVSEVEGLVCDVEPDVLIVDQLRNIRVKDDNFTRQLEQAASGIRQIAGRRNCLAVSVTQAGDSATGKAILEMGDVDSSNTGIPAQADVMVGIGGTRDDESAFRRVLSLCKNKRSGNHDFFSVQIDPILSRVRSLE